MISLPNLFGGIQPNVAGGFEPNPLEQFNTYSPNIEMIIAPENDKSINNYTLKPGTGITIASTGKTANFYIDKVSMRSTPSSSLNAIQSIVTEIIVEITEPLGFTFFDKYFEAVFRLNWKLATDAVIFMSISYNGWNENGSPSPRYLKSTWKCTLTGIKVETESSATRYTITLIPIGQQEGLTSENHIIDRPFTSEIKESFIDTVSELEKVFNETAINRDPQNMLGTPEKIYKFKVGPKLAELNPKMPIKLDTGTTTIQVYPDGTVRFVADVGSTVSDMLVKLANNIVGISRVLNPRVDENFDENIEQPLSGRLMQHFVIVPEAGYGGFDTQKNRYIRVIEYTIDLTFKPEAEQSPPNDLGSKEKADNYIKNGLLKKRYDYIFTGQNTEVLDVKLDFNAAFSHLVSSYGRMNAESQAPNIDEGTRKAENGLDLLFAKISNLSKIFGNLGTLFGISNIPTEKLMETLPPSGILATLHNFKIVGSTINKFNRSGVGVPKDSIHAKNVEQSSNVDARVNNRNAYQEFNGGALSSMAKLEITVRGDPYWIGKTHFNDTTPLANFYTGTQKFYFKYRLGEPHDERTGLTPTLGNVTFNGIYSITEIISVFEGGKFTQKLTGVIDTTTLGVQY